MTRKFETEKHFKKRHKHFIGQDQLKPKEKMAGLEENVSKSEEKPATSEKTENANPVVEPAKQTANVKATPITDVAPTLPVTPQPTFQFARKKNALEKLKDKFHQLMSHFK
jgi:hypothetical protein